MVRPVAPLRALANVRALHTTPVRMEQSSREITSDFLTRLLKQSPPSSTPASSSGLNAKEAARGMINSIGMKEDPSEGRKRFTTKKILTPDVFRPDQLYPPLRGTYSKPPLLGPSNKIAKRIDPFHIRSQDPVDHASNPLMCDSFIEMSGRIKKRSVTGLTWKSQRRVGKMIRRARAMGVISTWINKPRVGGLGHTTYGGYDNFRG